MINIELTDNVTARITTPLTRDILTEVVNACSYEVQGSFFAPQVQMGYWDGHKRLFSSATQKFPVGLYSLVAGVLKAKNLEYTVTDLRKAPKYEVKPFDLPGIDFRDYQIEMIHTGIKIKRGIMQAATGSGKSLTIVGLSKALSDLRINIYVHRSTLLRQLQADFEKCGIVVGVIGDGEKRVRDINICSFQSVLTKYETAQKRKRFYAENLEIIQRAEVMIVDECHHLVAELFNQISELSTNAYFRFGFSATPLRDEGDDIEIQAGTGRKIITLNASELIRRGYLVRPTIFFLKVPAMPGLPKQYQSVYSKAVVENEMRNEIIAETAKTFIDAGQTCLIAVTKIKHGEAILAKLEELMPDVPMRFIQGDGTTGVEKLQVLDDLNKKKLKIVVATTVFGEGVNVPTLGALINANASKSFVGTMQLCGRVLRPHKDKKSVVIVDIADQTRPYLKEHTDRRKRILATEPEFKIVEASSLAELKILLEKQV